MYRILCAVLALLASAILVFAQPFTDPKTASARPTYRSAKDSVELALLEQTWASFRLTPASKTKTDSMINLVLEARSKAIVDTRPIYQNRYPLLAEARQMPADTVRAISLVAVKSWPKELSRYKNLETLEVIDAPLRKLAPLRSVKKLKTLYVLNPTAKKTLRLPKRMPLANLLIRGASEGFVPDRISSGTLLQLNLAQNGLTRMPDVSRANPLRVLVLRSNAIRTLESYRGNTSLKELELQLNQMQEVPASIAGFSGLHKLVLSGNQIRNVSPALAELKNLEQLAFYKNELNAVPSAVYELTNLRVLDLYYNQIERLDDAIARWKKLEVLYVSHNRIVNLPDAFADLRQLKELYVHNNRISVLPASLAQLTELKVLRANNNLLSELPTGFSALTNLDFLDLAHNQFRDLPIDLGNFPKLELLTLSFNPLERENRVQWQNLAVQLRQRGVVVNAEFGPEPTSTKGL